MKILASDFDETIYYLDNPEKNKMNCEAIRNFVANGNIFCIITGRNYTDLKQLLIANNIPYSYLICEDGAKIFNNMDYCLDTVLLDENDIKQIVQIIEEYNWDYYLDDGYNHTNNYNDCVKIVINCIDEEDKRKTVDIIKQRTNVHIYASRTHVNIIHRSVNKKHALQKLINLEKLDYNNLYVIGDNDNDYEMLKSFNGGVMKRHNPILNELGKNEYELLKDYIEELMNN